MALSIREAGLDDLDRIVLFNAAMARETEGRELDRSLLAKGVGKALADPALARYFLADQDGEVVGQLCITTEWSDWRNGPVWWIQSVYVSRRHRGRGIYRRLHHHVRDLARSEGAVGLRLYVDRDNEEARSVYAALGMRPSHYLMYEEMWK